MSPVFKMPLYVLLLLCQDNATVVFFRDWEDLIGRVCLIRGGGGRLLPEMQEGASEMRVFVMVRGWKCFEVGWGCYLLSKEGLTACLGTGECVQLIRSESFMERHTGL
ncbi:UNVERIFIED_CONTAM: hypothetical protein K2H54_017555 [Gekko kuhli]